MRVDRLPGGRLARRRAPGLDAEEGEGRRVQRDQPPRPNRGDQRSGQGGADDHGERDLRAGKRVDRQPAVRAPELRQHRVLAGVAPGGSTPHEPGERQRSDHAGQRVRGDRQADVHAELAGRGDPDGEPGDGDDAHPVAERRDAEPGQQPSRPAIPQQGSIHGRDHDARPPGPAARRPASEIRAVTTTTTRPSTGSRRGRRSTRSSPTVFPPPPARTTRARRSPRGGHGAWPPRCATGDRLGDSRSGLLPALGCQLVGFDADDLASHRVCHLSPHGADGLDASFERGLVGVKCDRYQPSSGPVGQEVDCCKPLQALQRGNDLLVDDLDCVVDLYCVTFDRADSRLHSHDPSSLPVGQAILCRERALRKPSASWSHRPGFLHHLLTDRVERMRPSDEHGWAHLTAFFTSAPILASSAAVNFFSAKETGHRAPLSRFAASLKPNVAYLVLNFCALWKKQTTLPSLAYAGIPYQSLGERAGALALMSAWSRSPRTRSASGIAAIVASTALSPSALSARGPGRAAAFFAAFLAVLLADFCVPFAWASLPGASFSDISVSFLVAFRRRMFAFSGATLAARPLQGLVGRIAASYVACKFRSYL